MSEIIAQRPRILSDGLANSEIKIECSGIERLNGKEALDDDKDQTS